MRTFNDILPIVNLVAGQVHDSEMEALYNHCLEFNKALYVEIGSYQGKSATVLAEVALETSSRVICVDKFPKGYEDPGYLGVDAFAEFQKNILDKYSHVRLLKMSSDTATKLVPNDINVLFIDGDHSYEQVALDCVNYLPKVLHGGYVAFHDYNNVGAFPGVRRAVDQATLGWELTDSVWDLIIKRKP